MKMRATGGEDSDLTIRAYESIAPFYDRITRNSDYTVWCDKLLEIAYSVGLKGNRVLDVATGTGKMACQFQQRGFDVKGCDLSPAMLKQAELKPGFTSQDFFVADMRTLPECGTFDLVVVVDDALNYCQSISELRMTFESIYKVLESGGLFIADLNTLRAYVEDFSKIVITDEPDFYFVWHGDTPKDFKSGGSASLKITLFNLSGDTYDKYVSIHHQTHFAIRIVLRSLKEAKLQPVSILGINSDGTFDEVKDEEDYKKMILVARKPS